MGYWAKELNLSVPDQCLASLSLFWERYNRSEESDLKFEAFMHSSSLTCPNVSMSASFSSSSTSDTNRIIDSALYLDIGGEERKLNCGLLDRSSSRRTGCEGKLWPAAERDCDQDLIRAFSSSVGYSEDGSCTTRSDSQRCLDGACEQSDCINAGKGGQESEVDEGVEDDTGSEEHRQGEQVDREEKHDRVIDSDHDRGLRVQETEVEEAKPSHRHPRSDTGSCTFIKVSKSDFTTRMPAKSTERLPIVSNSRGAQQNLESVEHALRRRTEGPLDAVSSESLGPSVTTGRFRESAESPVDPVSRVLERGKETQLAEGRSRSHEFFGERLDVDGSRRDDGSGLQIGLSSSWGDDLRGRQEHLSFPGEDTAECITNVGDQDDFGTFDVEEFQTPDDHGQKHNEPLQETERLSEFHTRGENSQDGQSSPSPTFESPPVTQNETTLRTTRASTRPRSSAKESGDSNLPVDGASRGRKIPDRIEAGRVGKGQEKDLRGEGHLQRLSEASIPSEDSRRVRARLDHGHAAAASGRGTEETEDVISTKVVRPSRPSGGKDRHSKVNTAKGPRDRRVRLSVPTAVQFYDVQDRLGYDQPSKAVEWLIKKAKAAIDELGRLPPRGIDGPSTLSDITHAGSPYSTSLGGPVSGSSSCLAERSFSGSLNSTFGDPLGNQMGYFLDSSSQQGALPFGTHPGVHSRDIVEGMGLSQANLVTGQGQLAGMSFPLGQTDLSRGSPGCMDGGKPGEFPGRVESRCKARERARERAKEKGTGRDCGNVTGGGSSPSSMQSPPLHQNPVQNSFGIQNAMQTSVHSLQSLQNPHPSPLQPSHSSVFDTTLSGIIQSSQQGTLQNLIMQNPSLQSPLADQVQSSLQHPFQASLPTTLQLTSQSMTSLLTGGMQQQPHLQRSSLEGGGQRGLHPGSGFAPGPCSSSFSEATALSSSDFMSVSSIPIPHSLSMSELSSYGITSPSSMEPHFPSGSSAVQIPPGFSPGPPASAFRSRPAAISQSSSKESQPHLQGLTRPQLMLPPYSTGHALASPGGSTSSGSTSLYYPPTSSRRGSLQSLSPVPLESSSFSSVRNPVYDYPRVQMMSPGRASGSYQSSSSQLQMPARLHGLDDFGDELKSSPPSSPHVHP